MAIAVAVVTSIVVAIVAAVLIVVAIGIAIVVGASKALVVAVLFASTVLCNVGLTSVTAETGGLDDGNCMSVLDVLKGWKERAGLSDNDDDEGLLSLSLPLIFLILSSFPSIPLLSFTSIPSLSPLSLSLLSLFFIKSVVSFFKI